MVFFDDFESGAGEWATGSDGLDGTVWELGSPAEPGPAAAYSPSNCFGTNLDGEYTADANVWLRSPPIDLTTAAAATLSFREFVSIEEDFDFGTVSVLDAADDSELAVLKSPIDGETVGWEEFTQKLPAEALGKVVKIEFRLRSDDLMHFAGWYLDDVTVTVP